MMGDSTAAVIDGGGNAPFHARRALTATQPQRFWAVPLVTFLACAVAISVAGVLMYQSARSSVTAYVDLSLQTVVRLKADQIAHWLEEAEELVEVQVDKGSLAADLRSWQAAGRRDGPAADRVVDMLARLCSAPEAIECSVLSPADGHVWLSNGFDRPRADDPARALAAMRMLEPQFEDVHDEVVAGESRREIGYFYAVRDTPAPAVPIGIVHMTIDPSGLLDVVSGKWPGLASSVETRLLRREGNRLVEVIGGAGAPAGDADIYRLDSRISQEALHGYDERHVPVIAHALPVSGTPWYVFTKLDQEQAYAEINTLSTLTSVTLGAVLLVGCLSWAGRRRHLIARERDRFERLVLLRRIDYLARFANDAIFLCEPGGRILEVNDRCLSMYGYEPDEMIGRNLAEFTVRPADSAVAGTFATPPGEGGLIYEAEHLRKDGTTLPVEVSARLIVAEGQQSVQAIVRDISERRRLETERAFNLDRFKELSRRLVSVQERERRTLSSELHDRTGGNLAAIKLNLSAIGLQRGSNTSADAAARELITETCELVVDTISQVRELCADLSPSVLEYAGLIAALESRAKHFSRRTGIETYVQYDEFDGRLHAEVESMLFRIVQEALTNCEKHSRARTIAIRLIRNEEGIELTVTDDGVGFDPREADRESDAVHLGIVAMRERVEFAGGNFRIESRPGHGTQIRVELANGKVAAAA